MPDKKQDYEDKSPPEIEMCQSCGVRPATVPHTCPYAEEMGNDYETLCNCCDKCARECALDI